MTKETIERLAVPSDDPRGPNCGITAIAVFTGRPFADIKPMFERFHKRPGAWKGGTTRSQRHEVLRELGVRFERAVINRRVTLATAARMLPPGRLYMVTVTGHVVTLKDGIISDQLGPRKLAGDRCGRKFVKDVVRLVEA